MPYCAVSGCRNHNRNTKGGVVRFYTFPVAGEFQAKWISACKRSDKLNMKNATICSVHFEDDCFFTPLRHSMLKYSPRSFRNLKSDAVPTKKLLGSRGPTETKVSCDTRFLMIGNCRNCKFRTRNLEINVTDDIITIVYT